MRLPLSLFFLMSGFFVVLKSFGQGLCDRGGGGFELDKTEGCAPLLVRITNTIPNPIVVGYNQAYDGRSTTPLIQEVSSYNYALPGTFTILQQAAISSGRVYACQKVTVYESRAVIAQYSSCGGGKVTLTLTEGAVIRAYDEVDINWGDGKTEKWKRGDALILEHNYADATSSPVVRLTGGYTQGQACARGATASLPISFQQAQLNSIEIKSVEMRGDGSIRLNYQGLTAVATEIKYSANGTNYVTDGKRSSGGLQPYDIKNLNKDQVYKLKLSSQDLCNGQRDSREYSSMTLSGKSEEGKNVLTWSQYSDADGFTGYDLLRDGTVIKSFTSISDVTYTDEDVQCGSYSEYQVVAKINDVTSTSAPVGVKTEISNARPIQEAVVAVVDDHSVVIQANVPGAGPNSTYDLSIEKAEAGSATFRKIITLYNENEYMDPDVKTNELSYCYRLSYQNSCGQKAPASQPICTILLTKLLSTLSWTAESPLLSGVASYEVNQTGSSGGQEQIPVQMSTSYTVKLNAQSDLEYSFQIRANSVTPGLWSLSNVINYKRSAGVFVPDAFSPNGDGYNDILEAKSNQLQSINFSIMNRWGEVVFHSDDISNSWDGTINGENAPVGYYIYKMIFVDDIDQTVEKNGTFMLLR
ncbi:T9SS type B sorting domain-containing protein [Dyadobacter bucti]|uniref:T9SS type B sorting domain-containing protein n=1 Tax=Dyadobacter bucti TaxID=2572203 RepID=UPI001E2DDC89|nr:gliding motility-associated C-terminal domain-containing protein [Dyadobacter bucti]